jgi:hypothetical protein
VYWGDDAGMSIVLAIERDAAPGTSFSTSDGGRFVETIEILSGLRERQIHHISDS